MEVVHRGKVEASVVIKAEDGVTGEEPAGMGKLEGPVELDASDKDDDAGVVELAGIDKVDPIMPEGIDDVTGREDTAGDSELAELVIVGTGTLDRGLEEMDGTATTDDDSVIGKELAIVDELNIGTSEGVAMGEDDGSGTGKEVSVADTLDVCTGTGGVTITIDGRVSEVDVVAVGAVERLVEVSDSVVASLGSANEVKPPKGSIP